MAYLSITQDGGAHQEATLDRAVTLLGRSPEDAHVILDDESVSRRHARVINDRGRYRLEAISEQGIRAEGQLLLPGTSIALKDGASFRIGSFQVAFLEAARASREATVTPGHTRTRAGTRGVTKGSGGGDGRVEPSILEVVEGVDRGKRWKLEEDQVFVGRKPELTVALTDRYVSGKHFALEWKGEYWKLVDLASSNETLVNGRRLARGEVAFGSEIRVGKTRLKLSRLADDRPGGKLPRELYDGRVYQGMIGTGKAMEEVFELLEQAARTDLAVLVLGETGTGKELVARALHDRSTRANGPFVTRNCATLAPTLAESELFGHERSAFTGADRSRIGDLELSDGGTLFLDEIGELSSDVQASLLRVLDSGELTRLGGNRRTKVDVRLVSATNRNLRAMIAEGAFREDLLQRINGFEVTLPPLSRRKEDLPELALHFLRACRKDGSEELSEAVLEKLAAHRWKGNIRELRNTILRAVGLSGGKPLTPDHIRFVQGGLDAAQEVSEEEERAVIVGLLKECKTLAEAARRLHIPRSTLHDRIKKLGIKRNGEEE